MAKWYSRPVLFVAEVERASAFYVDRLGFTEAWRFPESDGRVVVAQVVRDGSEFLLSSQWPNKVGGGMMFIALTATDWRALPDILAARDVAFAWGHWGYRTLIIDDPDGNQLFFPDPDDPGSM